MPIRPMAQKLIRTAIICSAWLLGGLVLPTTHAAPPEAAGRVQFSQDEIALILKHGPWPVPRRPDPSNRASNSRDAIDIGEKLFFDPRLSITGTVSCSTCHDPERHWTDGLRRASALGKLPRNTPHIMNLGGERWFGLDGGSDSLWSQIIKPMLDRRELGASAAHVAKVVGGDGYLSCVYRKVYGTSPAERDHETVLVDTAKLIAAFVETLSSGRTPFDEFRDALARGDGAGIERYGEAAKRGLRIFIGKGNCASCHSGPQFTNAEFRNNGAARFMDPKQPDTGRLGAIKSLAANRFNLLGPYNDDPSRSTTGATKIAMSESAKQGDFRVPSLRHTGFTAPYMHDGSVDTLRDVIRHYAEAKDVSALKPFALTARETNDLIVFLETLTNFRMNPWRPTLTPGECP